MLKILDIEIKHNRECSILCDYYVPISIEFMDEKKDYMKGNVVYWESRDRKEGVSLIEIGIDESTGKIQNIALTAAQGYENKLLDMKESVLVQGDPIVDLKKIENNIVDSIDVFLSKRKIEITLCDVKHIKKIISIADKLQIGLNCNQELVYIAVCEVDSDVMEVFKESLM